MKTFTPLTLMAVRRVTLNGLEAVTLSESQHAELEVDDRKRLRFPGTEELGRRGRGVQRVGKTFG